MSLQSFATRFAVTLLVGMVPVLAGAQARTDGTETWTPSRDADGRPDLQGVWGFRTITPLQRPAPLGDREVLTDEEAAAFEAQAAQASVPQLNGFTYNAFWWDFGTNVAEGNRTSLIVDPPDGRLPDPIANIPTQFGSLTGDVPSTHPVRYRSGGIGADGPEDRGLAERCILGFNSRPPMVPSGYNNNMQLFQNADHVVVLNEMVHDARVVPLDGRPHLPEDIRQWMGDSRGHWKGDTLVVDTTNFTAETSSFSPSAMVALGSGEHLHLTERFTRVGPDTLLYEFTVRDPRTFTRPFTAAVPMKKLDAPIFEYACHEGNYGMVNLLSGARAEDPK